MLDINLVRQFLRGDYKIKYYPEIGSTNDRALELARAGTPGGIIIAADFQTAGRGRHGATWTAPSGCCLLFSFLIRPVVQLPTHHLVILAGVGVANGLRMVAPQVKIKWPNDIMLEDRKIAGILIETHEDATVIGVGINCTVPQESFPEEFRHHAGSLHTLTGREICREKIMSSVLKSISEAMERVEAGGIIKVLIEWNSMNWLAKRKVRVAGPMGVVDGDGLFLDGRRLVFHVFKDCGVVAMPLSSTVEVR